MGACVCRQQSKAENSRNETETASRPDGSSTSQVDRASRDESATDTAHGVRGAGRNHRSGGAERPRQELKIFIDSNLSSSLIDSLVLQTLSIIRTLVDNEQPPPEAMMQLHKIADVEIGWLAIVLSMIRKITSSDPLGPAVITLILDECPLPSKEAILKLTNNLNVSKESSYFGKQDPMRQRNICILYGFLAEKLAGSTSVALLTDHVLDYLLANLESDKEPYVILHSIVALEKFALTTENKMKILSHLSQTENNVLMRLEQWRNYPNDYLRREVGFCAEWTLDNLFVLTNRKFTYEQTDNTNLNAMLNTNDTSEYLKISPNGVEARSDVLSFESVRCTFQIDSGAWYYEVELITNGVLQIGWATKYSKFLNYDGFGIGDDEYSLAYDGCRQLIWHNAQSRKHSHPCWNPGDILGCFLDVNNKEAIFSLNGKQLPSCSEIFQHASKGFFAAASFMTFQQCVFNFGNKPFRYPPSVRFDSFNGKGQLTEEDRLVLPRHKKIEVLRRMSVKEDGCQLCFDNQANVTLKPCNHSGFCSGCAVQLDNCPLCRTSIEYVDHESMRPLSKDGAHSIRTQLSHDKNVAFSENRINDDQSVK